MVYAMRFQIFILFSFWATFSFAYTTSCEIVHGKAYGYATSEKYQSLTISGNVTFIFYDNEWKEIDRDTVHEYEYIYNDTELVEEEKAPSDATRCFFDISQAVDEDENGENGNQIPTGDKPIVSCLIVNGTVYGYVKTPKYESIKISGAVTFTFFNNRMEEIDKESSYEYAYIYNSSKLVAEEDAPSDAMYCDFDITQALE